ncbi:methyltransferase domain-containing protein [Solirubrobacter soli]|uniref:methyltransferase domain-containing protein n=1 Tax=Solirubrobacter soli TaxID=363832 RepID=UPI000483373D|nr:methyltransferase domain-containing protein [Solirubrobacter soli]
MTHLEIGGGTAPRAGYLQLDPVHGVGEMRRRVQEGIPLDDNVADRALASHVLEHIPAGPDRITTFNEIHRVLKPGGVFEIVVPLIGYSDEEWKPRPVHGWQPFADPTHVSVFWFPESLLYFCEAGYLPSADYGIRRWAPLERDAWYVKDGWEGFAVLRKPG